MALHSKLVRISYRALNFQSESDNLQVTSCSVVAE